MDATNPMTSIRELMPDLFLRAIMERVKTDTGKAPQMATISDVVSNERFTSKYWPYIEKLAMETNLKLYHERMAYLRVQAAEPGVQRDVRL